MDNRESRLVMTIEDAMELITQIVNGVNRDRKSSNKPVSYEKMKDALIPLHRDWQSLMDRIKNRSELPLLESSAVSMAASVIKLLTDLETIKNTPEL